MSADDILRDLHAAADPEVARRSQRFFKTGPGEYAAGDQFIGVRLPVQRKLARRYRDVPLDALEPLLGSAIHEHRQTALLILEQAFGRVDEDQQRAIFEFCCRHLARIDNWDLVDQAAPKILGPYILAQREHLPMLYRLARSSALWERRIAIMCTFAFLRAGHFDDTLAIAEILVRDEHDLIHKAVGWMLRELGQRALERERAFLDRHAGHMPRTMLRYAIETFPAELRAHYMQLGR
ncbi:DNA alkylation repair protein [Haliangium ochraceum]|uniref:DNA alkylation repair enzyme n=1 Tax=Haliangium ochraceum (strain DSM 14365 / JCM 11303 / SMP-2) TaxID=502025 RepID=D0LR29_HALO1|nr:DNA alkylation repair protein [Haliangium ochraceum]ACY15537.1 DNA alkylation repair enzyme [Haliangium ochraceum DSM 14365]